MTVKKHGGFFLMHPACAVLFRHAVPPICPVTIPVILEQIFWDYTLTLEQKQYICPKEKLEYV